MTICPPPAAGLRAGAGHRRRNGPGARITLALAGAGVDVVVMGRRAELLEETRELASGLPGKVRVEPGSVRDENDVDRVFAGAEEDGPVPMLLHAAAGAFLSYAEDISPNGFRAVVDTGLNGAFLILRRWARPLIDAGSPGWRPACRARSAPARFPAPLTERGQGGPRSAHPLAGRRVGALRPAHQHRRTGRRLNRGGRRGDVVRRRGA